MTLMLVSLLLAQAPLPQCDPMNSSPQPVPVPKGKGLKCGDGKVSAYTASCTQLGGGGGCGRPPAPLAGPLSCVQAREVCDGQNLDGQSCQSLGFASGQLACDGTCQGFDVSGCEACLAGPAVKCQGFAAGAPTVSELQLTAGPRSAALTWVETVGEEARLRLALVDEQRAVVVPAPLKVWKRGELTPRISAVETSAGLVLLQLADGRLSVARVDAQRAAGPFVPGEADVARALVVRSAAGAEALLLESPTGAPRVVPLSGAGAFKPVAVREPLHGLQGDRRVLLAPVPPGDAGAGGPDLVLAELWLSGGADFALFRAGARLPKPGPWDHSVVKWSQLDAKPAQLGLGLEGLEVHLGVEGDGFVDTVGPKGGPVVRFTDRLGLWARDPFARHGSVGDRLFVTSGTRTVGVAVVRTQGKAPTLSVAFIDNTQPVRAQERQ